MPSRDSVASVPRTEDAPRPPREIRKLAIVGASARAAAFSALRAGYDVTAADLFADADLRRECSAARIDGYPDALADWLAATECDAWLYTGALENHVDLLTRMAAIRPLLGVCGEPLRQVRDPLLLQRAAREAGLCFPETIGSPAGLPLDGSWLCKTYRSGGGAGVWSLNGEAARARAVRADAVYQRRVDGVPAAAVFAAFESGSALLGVTRQLLAASAQDAEPWRYRGSVGPWQPCDEIRRQLEALGDLLANRFKLRGLIGVDMVVEDHRAWIVEVNPRYSASVEVVEQCAGCCAIGLHVAAFSADGAPPVEARPLPAATDLAADVKCGKSILFARQDVVISDNFHRWAMERAAVDPQRRELADVPPAGATIAAADPVLTVFAAGRDCEQLVEERLAEVERRLYAPR